LAKRFVIWVVLPTLIASLYYGVIASSEYESVATVALGTTGDRAVMAASDNTRAKDSGVTSSDKRIGLLLRDYAQSRDMLQVLTGQHGFARHYQSEQADVLSRLPGDTSKEDVYALFREKVSVVFAADAGTLRIRVFAYSPDAAQKFVTAVRAALTLRLASMHGRARSERVAAAERDSAEATTRWKAKRAAMLASRKSEVASGASTPPPAGVADIEFRQAQLLYEAAAGRLRAARLGEMEQRSYLMTIVAPSLPDSASRPKRLWSISTVFVVTLLLLGVVGLLTAAVREHANF
jgi:capsular polysaccharide transport system permease protein